SISESKQLWGGAIPYFSVNFNGTEIYCGGEVVSHVSKSPESEFISKIKNTTKKDFTRQVNLIRLAFVARLADPNADGTLQLKESEFVMKNNTKLNKINTVKNIDTLNHRKIK